MQFITFKSIPARRLSITSDLKIIETFLSFIAPASFFYLYYISFLYFCKTKEASKSEASLVLLDFLNSFGLKFHFLTFYITPMVNPKYIFSSKYSNISCICLFYHLLCKYILYSGLSMVNNYHSFVYKHIQQFY